MSDLQGALQSLEGLSVGDAFGNLLHFQERAVLEKRELLNGPWSYTDDTEMALSVAEQLLEFREIRQDKLATAFAIRFNPRRGYGDGARRLMHEIGTSYVGAWRTLSRQMFFGSGSYGNGGAMRVAPLGAYFHNDYKEAAYQAALSAEVTHSHHEGIQGAVAVAIGAAYFRQSQAWGRDEFFSTVLEYVRSGKTRDGIEKARDLASDTDPFDAGRILGNGHEVAAHDTVPLCLWAVAVNPDSFEDAFWRVNIAGGDQDTTAAITCGIIAARTPAPAEWVARSEKLPDELTRNSDGPTGTA